MLIRKWSDFNLHNQVDRANRVAALPVLAERGGLDPGWPYNS